GRRQGREVVLDLRAGVEGHAGRALGTGRHAQGLAGETDDVVALAVLAAVDAVLAVRRRNPGGHEVVLQPGDPAALNAGAQRLVILIAHGDLLVVLLGGPDCRAQVGGGSGGGRGRIRTVVALELRVGRAAPGLVAVVVDQVLDLQVVAAAGKGEALGVVDTLIGMGQIDHQLVLTVGQLVVARFGVPARTTAGAVRRLLAEQAALGQIGHAAV